MKQTQIYSLLFGIPGLFMAGVISIFIFGAVIQPVVQMVVFSLLFGGVAGLSSQGLPYPLFNFTALLPWGLLSKAINDAGRSLVNNRTIITFISHA